MADLTFLERSNPVQVVGGDELHPADVTANKDLCSVDILRYELLDAAISVGLTAIEAKAGASRLVDRKMLYIFNNSRKTIFWGTTGVTALTGSPIPKARGIILEVSDIPIFLIALEADLDARVKEGR